MSSRPWIAWYPADYRAKTGHLSFEQSEAYRRLLEAYYDRQGRLVNDRPSLYRICGAMTDSERAAIDHAADQFFTIQNGYLVNGRANKEIQICEENRKRLSAAGHRGGLIAGKGRPKKTIGLEQARSPLPLPLPLPSPSPSPSQKQKDNVALARDLLAFLNEKARRRYQPVKANLEFITARLRDGATEQELRQVIAKKCREWAGDEKMALYLRPATLFNRTKFAQYQGELGCDVRTAESS